eukprot:TRINITY_DN3346_c0_g2_i1.p1 TRINITY_DN3346_c0_g2~~TRINITY_DN3346_c0_g2_i1.p1  ORF type:complete len:106 (-),score=0.64 TRINITY_DN3346_c0_g2_i1:442-759(-)
MDCSRDAIQLTLYVLYIPPCALSLTFQAFPLTFSSSSWRVSSSTESPLRPLSILKSPWPHPRLYPCLLHMCSFSSPFFIFSHSILKGYIIGAQASSLPIILNKLF